MPGLVEWMSMYSIEQNPSGSLTTLTNKPDYNDAVDIGVEGTGSANGVFRLMLENRPDLEVPDVLQELDVVTGRADRHVQNFEATTYDVPTATIEGPANSYICSLLFWSLFQSGATEATVSGTVSNVTCTVYTDPDPEMYFSLTRVLVDPSTSITNDNASQYFTGCIVRSITLSSEERGVVKYSAEVLGASHNMAVTDAIGSVDDADTWDSISFPAKPTSWKFQDFTCEIDGTATKIPNFSVTFSNNVAPLFYNSSTIQGYKLGNFTVEGSFFMPWSAATVGGIVPVTKYKAGTDYTLELFTTDGAGQNTTSNDVDIALNVKTTSISQTGDVETGHEINFSGVYDGSNLAVQVIMSYLTASLDRNIP